MSICQFFIWNIMKKFRIYFVMIILGAQTQVMADDKRVSDTTIFNEIATEYTQIEEPVIDPAHPATSLIILDDHGNVIREAEISSFGFNGNPAVFSHLLFHSDFLTEINGVLYFRWR